MWWFHSIDCMSLRIIKIPMVAKLLLNLLNNMTLPRKNLHCPIGT